MSEKKIHAIWSKQVKTVPSDFTIDEWANEVFDDFRTCEEDIYEVEIGSSIQIDILRCYVIRGKLLPRELIFEYKQTEKGCRYTLDYELKVDRYARLEEWPKEFACKSMDLVLELM